MSDDEVLVFDPASFTYAEDEELYELCGLGLDDLDDLLRQGKNPPPKASRAIAFIVMRRADPGLEFDAMAERRRVRWSNPPKDPPASNGRRTQTRSRRTTA